MNKFANYWHGSYPELTLFYQTIRKKANPNPLGERNLTPFLKIRNHRLEGDPVTFAFSPNIGGYFGENLPDTIVLHFTDLFTADEAVTRLCDTSARVSAHLVVGRDGKIWQLAAFDRIAWHAGPSRHGERYGLNNYAIGIEMDNAGRLRHVDHDFLTWQGKKIPAAEIVWAPYQQQQDDDDDDEMAYWHSYPPAQVELVTEICRLLIAEYPIRFILGHDEISPGRKIDPGPAFPMSAVRKQLLADFDCS